MLSGGAFLGSCLRQMGKPRDLYIFSLGNNSATGKNTKSHEYVRDYMGKLDQVRQLPVESMVQTMRRIYELTEVIMDEAQALQPHIVREKKKKKTNGSSKHKQLFDT